MRRPFIIITSTDPSSQKGGIPYAMLGYFAVFNKSNIPYKFIATHNSSSGITGKWWPLLKAIPLIVLNIRLASKKGFSIIVYSHSGPGVSLLRNSIVLFIARQYGAKTILHLHTMKVDNYLKNQLKSYLFNIAISPADRICVLTAWWKERLRSSGIKKQLTVIPNPLPKHLEKKAQKFQLDTHQLTDTIKIVSMTRIEPGKGVDVVINAMQFLPNNTQLIVAGDGSQLPYLIKIVGKLKLSERVTFTGWVYDEGKDSLFNRADVFCLPSSYDSFGMVFLEAMARGIPVVALGYGPIKDVVIDNHTGILIDRPDPKLCADAIRKIVANKKRYECMKKMSNKLVLERFSAQRVGDKIKSMLNELIE